MLYLGNARVIGNIIYGGICERFPELKIVSVESGIGWVPFMLQALDYQAGENNITHLPLKPSEYFRRQMYACFWFEGMDDTLLYDMERVGIDRCMFETDFPHPTCLYPDPLKLVGETVAALDRPIREMILSGTAAKVYNLDVPVD
jgi:predicted TIM-barrel fold metal-dependent hydrolase